MESKETDYHARVSQTLVHNEEFYKYIFKKTEKIVCAVFYTLRENESIRHDDRVVHDLETSATIVMDTLYKTLRAPGGSRDMRLEDIGHTLLVLESKLTISCAAHILPRELLEVFSREIGTVMRTLKTFLERKSEHVFDMGTLSERRTEKVTPRQRTDRSQSLPKSPLLGAPAQNRTERILGVIKDMGEATIKDISETVTECSEKTIQRELIELIKDGKIVREGERRWSKYKVVQ